MTRAVGLDRSRLAESIASYDLLAGLYEERYAALDTSRFLDWVTEGAGSPTPLRALDVGCGTGRDAAALAQRGLRVTGIDLSTGMLERAVKNASGAFFGLANALALPFPRQTFDVVWSMASLVHLGDGELCTALAEMGRVAKTGAAIFVSVPRGSGPEWRANPAGARRWFNYFDSAESLVKVGTAAGLRVERIEDVEGEVQGQWINALLRPARNLAFELNPPRDPSPRRWASP